jgi:hypothetical protein
LTGGVTLALNAVPAGSEYLIDFTSVTLGAQTVTISNGAGTFVATTILATGKLLNCWTPSAALVNCSL